MAPSVKKKKKLYICNTKSTCKKLTQSSLLNFLSHLDHTALTHTFLMHTAQGGILKTQTRTHYNTHLYSISRFICPAYEQVLVKILLCAHWLQLEY